MRILLAILFLAQLAFGQGAVVIVDTLDFLPSYTGYYQGPVTGTWYSGITTGITAFEGEYKFESACTMKVGYFNNATNLIIQSNYYPGSKNWNMHRGIISFETSSLASCDSAKLLVNLFQRSVANGDSLFAVPCSIKCGPSDCGVILESCISDSCNFYRCGDYAWADTFLDYYSGEQTGWVTFDIEGSYIETEDTTVIGLATRIYGSVSYPPGGTNFFGTYEDSIAKLICYSHQNDISYQSADGISPDTLHFVCSEELDSIRTPGQWRNEYLPTWLSADPTAVDCYHGQFGNAGDCDDEAEQPDSSRCGNYWNYAQQPNVRASKRGDPYNDFHQIRAYILGEVEEPIPTWGEVDSIKIHLRTGADFDDADGDSLFMVSYTPYYHTADTCCVCYGCYYTAIVGLGGCNYYKCGDESVYGDVIDPSQGQPILQYQWQWHRVDTSIVDLTQAALGDTFGLGFVRKHPGSIEPTGDNDTNIMVGNDCPYIVYWFSKREEKGFINWGLHPPNLGWGLPIGAAKKTYGGGKMP